eukprot:gene29276-12519_t
MSGRGKRGGAKAKAKWVAKAKEVGPVEADRLVKLLDQGNLPAEDLLNIVGGNAKPCESVNACKSNTKSNPNCFCGLAPTVGSNRKKGLWQKDLCLRSSLGPDPLLEIKEDPSKPAGLNNLGNTCYVNTALQCLYSVPSFRSGLYSVSEGSQGEGGSEWPAPPVVAQLQKLFLKLNYEATKSVDPSELAACLNLDHGVQQDCQEFFKLLVTKLESCFASSPNQDVRTLVQDLFRGTYSYVTTCKSCKKQSESSQRMFDFYELQTQVKGVGTLQQSLITSLETEALEGDNQYWCEFCSAKTDASRQMALRTVPPYLCLQLQRFVFDYQQMDKKKVTDKFSFPLDLDLKQFLISSSATATRFPLDLDLKQVLDSVGDDTGLSQLVKTTDGGAVGSYELVAVLIHKGPSASHGHYVAHVKSQASGKWCRFDDESVFEMGAAPITHSTQDHGTADPAKGTKGKADPKKEDKGGLKKEDKGGPKKGRPKKSKSIGGRGGGAENATDLESVAEDVAIFVADEDGEGQEDGKDAPIELDQTSTQDPQPATVTTQDLEASGGDTPEEATIQTFKFL